MNLFMFILGRLLMNVFITVPIVALLSFIAGVDTNFAMIIAGILIIGITAYESIVGYLLGYHNEI